MPLPFETPAKPKTTNGPPEDARPSELFSKMSDRARPHVILDWIRNDDDGKPLGRFWMQVLTQSEIDRAQLDAELYIRRQLKSRAKAFGEDESKVASMNQEAWRDMYQSALMVELLYHACCDVDDASKPLFRSPDDIREGLQSSEISHLANSYDALQHRYGPLWRELTSEEVDAWIAILDKGAEDSLGPLCLLSHGQLVQLIVSLASHLSNSQMGNSSAGLQSTDTASE